MDSGWLQHYSWWQWWDLFCGNLDLRPGDSRFAVGYSFTECAGLENPLCGEELVVIASSSEECQSGVLISLEFENNARLRMLPTLDQEDCGSAEAEETLDILVLLKFFFPVISNVISFCFNFVQVCNLESIPVLLENPRKQEIFGHVVSI